VRLDFPLRIQHEIATLKLQTFQTRIGKLATRPHDIRPEPITKTQYEAQNSIVALITIEEGDDLQDTVRRLAAEIRAFSKDTGIKTVVICPFGHLSNKLASSEKALESLKLLETQLTDFKTLRVHFGSHKSLLLDIHGHGGNVRFESSSLIRNVLFVRIMIDHGRRRF